MSNADGIIYAKCLRGVYDVSLAILLVAKISWASKSSFLFPVNILTDWLVAIQRKTWAIHTQRAHNWCETMIHLLIEWVRQIHIFAYTYNASASSRYTHYGFERHLGFSQDSRFFAIFWRKKVSVLVSLIWPSLSSKKSEYWRPHNDLYLWEVWEVNNLKLTLKFWAFSDFFAKSSAFGTF